MARRRQHHPTLGSLPGIAVKRGGRVQVDQELWPISLPEEVAPPVIAPGFAIFYAADSDLVEVAGYEVPREFYALLDIPKDAPRTALHVRIEGGEPVVQAVTVIRRPGELPLSASSYRKVNLRRLVEIAAARATLRAPGLVRTEQVAQDIAATRPTPRRGSRISDEFLEEVAAVYRKAVLDGSRSPTWAVGEHFHTARSNAGRWVMEARRRGLLGEAKPGQAGEKGDGNG
jgi:hypothetical protein